jgi:hypothetical protein
MTQIQNNTQIPNEVFTQFPQETQVFLNQFPQVDLDNFVQILEEHGKSIPTPEGKSGAPELEEPKFTPAEFGDLFAILAQLIAAIKKSKNETSEQELGSSMTSRDAKLDSADKTREAAGEMLKGAILGAVVQSAFLVAGAGATAKSAKATSAAGAAKEGSALQNNLYKQADNFAAEAQMKNQAGGIFNSALTQIFNTRAEGDRAEGQELDAIGQFVQELTGRLAEFKGDQNDIVRALMQAVQSLYQGADSTSKQISA